MKIDEIENGYVLDHITAGNGMRVYEALGLDKLSCQVAIIQNAKSKKLGVKDIIKVNELIDLNLDLKIRGEKLSLQDFARIADYMEEKR